MTRAHHVQLSDDAGVEGLLGYNLKRAYMIVRDDFRRQVEGSGLSPRAFSVLILIVDTPGQKQSDIARQLGIERSGLVAIIDDLEQKGLARRAAVPGDRRSQALVATAQGGALRARMMRHVEDHEAALLSALSPAERTQFLDLLRKFRAAHEGDEE